MDRQRKEADMTRKMTEEELAVAQWQEDEPVRRKQVPHMGHLEASIGYDDEPV